MASDSDGVSSDFYFKQGNELYEKKDFERAIGLYSDAIALENKNYKYFFNRGLTLACLNRYDGALEDFFESVKLKKDFAEGHYMIGICFENKNMINEAIQEYDKALQLKPNFRRAQDRKKRCKLSVSQIPDHPSPRNGACDPAAQEQVQSPGENVSFSKVRSKIQDRLEGDDRDTYANDDCYQLPQRIRTKAAKVLGSGGGGVVCGLKEFKDAIDKIIITPLIFCDHPMYKVPIARTSKGIILHGPPGCGKTLSVTTLAKENGIELVEIILSEVLNMWLGESEKNLTKVFDSAKKIAESGQPVILFIDELEALGASPSMTHEANEASWCRHLIATFRMLFNEIQDLPNIIVIGATNRVWSVDEALKRPGRLGSAIIYCPPPDKMTREELFRLYSRDTPGHESLDFEKLAEGSQWFSGDDIRCICRDVHFEIAKRVVKGETGAHAINEDFLRIIKGRSSQVINWIRQTSRAYQEGKIGENELEKQLKEDLELFNAQESCPRAAASDNGTPYFM